MIAAPPRLRLAARGAVLAAALFTGVALIGALPLGIPDNGDFRRYNRELVSGPAGQAEPVPRTPEEWSLRHGKRGWHRYWTLKSPDRLEAASSRGVEPAAWLWIPGVALHRIVRPGSELDLVWIGLLPRLLLLLAASTAAAAVALDALDRTSHCTLLAILPWPLLMTASAMTAYLNSFFREGSSFAFCALFVASLAIAPRLNRLGAIGIVAASGALLVGSAPAHGPLALLVALALFDFAMPSAPGRALRGVAFVAALAVLAVGLWRVTAVDPSLRSANAFNAVFLGLLPLSNAQEDHLAAMNLPREAVEQIGRSAYDPVSLAWRRHQGEQLDHRQVLKMIIREPALLPRAALAASRNLNRTSVRLERLLAEDSPRSAPRIAWNFWGETQRRYFPRGCGFLLWCVGAFLGGIVIRRLGDPMLSGIGRLVALAAGGSLLEAILTFVADGPMEPSRHLVVANFLLGASLAGALWLGLALLALRRRGAAEAPIS